MTRSKTQQQTTSDLDDSAAASASTSGMIEQPEPATRPWAFDVSTSDDDSSDAGEEAVGARLPLTSDPALLAVLETITGETPQEVDYAYQRAFLSCTPEGARTPERETMRVLAEAQRRAHERFMTSRAKPRKSGPAVERVKAEFPPFVMSTLETMEQHFAEHGASEGLRVKEIADKMGKHSGTVWHAVRQLVAARRMRPLPGDAKRFTAFRSCGEIPADDDERKSKERSASGDVVTAAK